MTYFSALCFAGGSWIHIPSDEGDPSAQQILELQQRLRPYVEEQAIVWRAALSPWERYTIQYQAQRLNGSNVIFINAMCTEPPSQASSELVYTLDGGACYFRVHWDPATNTFSGFSFNGEA